MLATQGNENLKIGLTFKKQITTAPSPPPIIIINNYPEMPIQGHSILEHIDKYRSLRG